MPVIITKKMETCENCLFYVDAMPDEVICVAWKKTKSYAMMKTNCKRWVEDTQDNANKWLKKYKEEEK